MRLKLWPSYSSTRYILGLLIFVLIWTFHFVYNFRITSYSAIAISDTVNGCQSRQSFDLRFDVNRQNVITIINTPLHKIHNSRADILINIMGRAWQNEICKKLAVSREEWQRTPCSEIFKCRNQFSTTAYLLATKVPKKPSIKSRKPQLEYKWVLQVLFQSISDAFKDQDRHLLDQTSVRLVPSKTTTDGGIGKGPQ